MSFADVPEVYIDDPSPGKLKRYSVPLLVVVSLLGLLFMWPDRPMQLDAPIDSIAVLPFSSSYEDPESQSLADGIPAAISSRLSRLPQLRVKPVSVLQRYKGSQIDPHTVSEEQGIRAVLTGVVERREDQLTVTVELVDGYDNALIWSQRYHRNWSRIFEIEEDIARQVAGALRLTLTPDESGRLAESGTQNARAYHAFMMGLYHFRRWPSPDVRTSMSPAIPHFKRAIEYDPEYQEAYYALANIYFIFGRTYYDESDADFQLARDYWERLVGVDPSTVMAHHTKARILWQYDHEWVQADREYRRAFELTNLEGACDSVSWMVGGCGIPYYYWFLEWMGRPKEYLDRLDTKLQQMDPLSPVMQTGSAWQLLWAREYERAMIHARRALELEPDWVDPWIIISFVGELQGNEREAFKAQLAAMRNEDADELLVEAVHSAFESSGIKAVRRLTHRDSGDKRNPRPINLVMAFLNEGNRDRAFELLKRAWSDPLWGGENAPSSPFLDPLRDDPRFEELLRKLNLPESVIARHLSVPGRE